jgi:ribosomal protein S18 acetylase RimI-like enzyme
VTAATETLVTRAFEERDLAAGARLIEQANWNQVDDDWRIFVARGAAFCVAAPDGTVVATAATLPYAGVAWISMILVDVAWRRRGIARRLIERCTHDIAASGRVPVLDATPAGRAVYAGMEFRDVLGTLRWARQPLHADASDAPGVRPLQAADLDAVVALDAQAFGAPRRWLIESLATRSAGFAAVAEREGAIVGAILGRPGRVATQLGPIIAVDEIIAIDLLRHAAARLPGLLYIDALDRHAALADALSGQGFTIQRPFSRMAWRCDTVPGDATRYFAAAGPELG